MAYHLYHAISYQSASVCCLYNISHTYYTVLQPSVVIK